MGVMNVWNYKDVTRQQFECVKDKVEGYIVLLGGKKIQIELPYTPKTISYVQDCAVDGGIGRAIYEYNGEYFRVDEVCFADKPYVVIEYCESVDEVMRNQMMDADPFPYDLSDEKMMEEVKYSMGIEPYPNV